jgi:hypothetical protein
MSERTTNVDAHMPPQPVDPDSTVWADEWNPETNEWAPSSEQHSVFGLAEPSHGDVQTAEPMPNDPGDPRTYQDGGGTPDVRKNLLTDVREHRQATPLPVQRVEHVVTTSEVGAALVRGRVVRVQGTLPIVLLEETPNRRRALLKCITTAAVIVINPLRQGGGIATTTAPAGNLAGFPLATGDPVHEVKSSAGVEAVVSNTAASPFCDVAVWEELDAPAPGLI